MIYRQKQDFLRVKDVSINYAEMMGINHLGQVETSGHLLILIFKYLKVSYVKERLDLICGREWASAHNSKKTCVFLLVMSHNLMILCWGMGQAALQVGMFLITADAKNLYSCPF